MKIENSVGIDIMRQAGEAARTAPKKSEEIPVEESDRDVRRDEYVPSEKDEPIGLYSMEQDENGDPEIKFDDPNKSDKSEKTGGRDEPEKEKSKSEECTCNTDKVDRELKRLREKAERLEQQLRSASDEEAAKIQKQLAGVQSELAQKDNDSYRRSQAEFS